MRFVRRISLALVVWSMAVAQARPAAGEPARANPPADSYAIYTEAVRTYFSAQPGAAIDALQRLPAADITAGAERLTRAPRGGAALERAAVMHAELALRWADDDPPAARLHARTAAVLARATNPVDTDTRRHWSLFAASLCLMLADFDGAQRFAGQAGESAKAWLLTGKIQEARAEFDLGSRTSPIASAQVGVDISGTRLRQAWLTQALQSYEHVLQIDREHVEARLRRGRVLTLVHQLPTARQLLDAVAAAHAAPPLSYLTQLFLGAIAEEQEDYPAALRHYEAARTIGPRYQTSYVALIHLAVARGQTVRTQQLADAFARIATTLDEDPWWSYLLGAIDREELTWLHGALS